MFFANDKNGIRINIDSAFAGEPYFCPACNCQMIVKHGAIVSKHFAHKSRIHCDPWYGGKMSQWHRRMQNKFPPIMREVVVSNDDNTEFHIADALVGSKHNGIVFEFQHSRISVQDFIDRTQFYINIGCSVVWVFDYHDCYPPKCIFYRDTEHSAQIKEVAWPSNDRVEMFDSEIFRRFLSECNNDDNRKLTILFHVKTGLGKRGRYQYKSFSYYRWEFLDAFNKEEYYIKPFFEEMKSIADFSAAFFTEEELDKEIQKKIAEFKV